MKRLLLTLLALTIPLNCFGADLTRLLQLAFENNPSLKEARVKWKISEVERREAFTGYLPRVELSYSRNYLNAVPNYSFSIAPGVPTTSFSLFNKSFYQFKVEALQPLFTGGRVSNAVNLKSNAAKAAFYAYKEQLNRVAYAVSRDYLNLLKANSMVEVAKATLNAARAHYEVVKAFYDQQIVARRDLLEAEVKVQEAKELLTRAEGQREVVKEQLKNDLGVEKLPPVEETLRFEPVEVPPKGKLLELALKERPLLLALRYAERSADSAIKLAVSSFAPQLSLGISYQRTSQYPGISPFSSTAVAVSLNFPIFEGGRRFLELEKAHLEKEKARLSLKKGEDAVRLQLCAAYSRYETALARVKTARKMVAQARELLRDSRERYKEQVGTSTQVVDAIAYLQKAKSSLVSAVADYYQALAQLNYAVGKRLFNFGEER